MKNLKILKEQLSKIQLNSEDEVISFAAFDVEHNRLFLASSSNFIYSLLLPSPHQNAGAWNSISDNLIDLEPGDFITSMDYLMEKEALIIGTSYGLLLLYTADDNTTEIVGRVEGGVKCVSPSPDGDLLGVITGFGQILMMTPDWDVLYEMALDDLPEDIDVHEHTYSSNYSSESSVSWRGDGKYFATLSRVNNSHLSHKKLKIWERDSGALHSVSESKPFMGSTLDWMPSGAKIAAVYDRKEDRKCPSIVFFERNGLERSSFCLNVEVDATVEFVKWNCNSDLLAAVVRGEKYDSLRIWFLSNNHWYLKQEIRYMKDDRVRFMWDPIKPQELISWTVGGDITTYNFVWITAVMNNSVALVIDDSKILITPLSLSLIPPPMYLFCLKFPSAIQSMAFCSKSSLKHLAASLSDGRLCVVELPAIDCWEELEGKEFDVEAASFDSGDRSFIHLAWLDSHKLLGVSHSQISNSAIKESSKDEHSIYCLHEIELVCSEDRISSSVTCSGWHAKVLNRLSLEGTVIGIVPDQGNGCSAYVQFDGGKVFEYALKVADARGLHRKRDDMSFSSSCPWMDLVQIGGCLPQKALLFGLDDSGRLLVGERTLCNNCSSFSFYSNSADYTVTHLILATKQDLLFIIDISDILKGELEVKYGNFLAVFKHKKGEDERNYIQIWERGAKIVGVLHGDESAIILQTVRGNLECIYPRKLVLASIINALIQGRYKDALLMVRRHRIDFNVIIDHCGWQNFVQSAAEFVKQVNNLSYITEFVCSIKNEKIMETLYKNYRSLPHDNEAKAVEHGDLESSHGNSKIHSVLLAIRKALEEHVAESPARELCILTTLARSDPPALEKALERIKIIREKELSGSDDLRRELYPSAEEALKHLLWLSDSEAVFEAALGLYDLNLAAIVALNSQKDPKEFLPYLQELENMPIVLMQYNIDLRLQRFETALQHIVSAGDAYFEDCMILMKKNPHLFPLGLQLVTDSVKKNQVLEAWGDHLSSRKCFEDAATTYLCCSCLNKALKAYRECGNWGGVLTVAGLIKLGKEEVLQLAHELCEELQALGKTGDAAKIALDYCADVNAGTGFLVSAREWEEALRTAFLHRRDDLVQEVRTASLECASSLVGEYEEGLEKVGKYLTRYLAVRQRRLLLAAKLQLDERSINELDDDTASETSSNFSGMSAYTLGTRKGSAASIKSSASTKARDMRRQRNRGKIRAGSPGEEIALVEHLKGMSLTTGAKRELKSLLICLVMLGKEDIARKLQHVATNFQLSQMAAVNLADEALSNDRINEHFYVLENYIPKIKEEMQHSELFSWQSKVLI
ncbi:PREDICTED: elongator complex protein 1 isoform X1 [Nicotiana attenuata]|uniref:Elongator complex protein 1 n=1 Tax=Nicotiana attenuata TaxID=49451 RepID=A0A1J6IE91_NICAT|nr:PREDICTED: elongator complex protein 1 isoform X1 [Nicotiana attenuata]XP_019245505.1 PREDICTED: elongator complex protein 1 isoform X1 [Nicotiana attenuata]XP_019245506.1 PREDICTED: elongator complex protein 1 isoform X1 [Nicotiana attenuata]OIT03214.1 elongator complex protein 1 [Nicotiana attenuata]